MAREKNFIFSTKGQKFLRFKSTQKKNIYNTITFSLGRQPDERKTSRILALMSGICLL